MAAERKKDLEKLATGLEDISATELNDRYRLEVLSFLFDSSYRKLYAAVKEYQEILGKMHDLDVFAAVSRQTAFSQSAAAIIMTAIAAKRNKLFAEFLALLEKNPFEKIGERMKDSL